MLQRTLDKAIANHYADSNKALLLSGARQVGKSFAIRKYAHSHYEHYIEINFPENTQAVSLLQNVSDVKDLLVRLSAISHQPFVKGKTFIFFDEVQVLPDILTWVKFLVEEGSYHYALSGSLLGTCLNDIRSVPVGFLREISVYPFTFAEFIQALGISESVFLHLQECWEQHTPVDSFIHEKMMQLFRLYLIVGGMPEAIQTYIDTNNLQSVWQVQHDIIQLYRQDISQYDPAHKLYIRDIFDLIPAELNAQNKRFFLNTINPNFKFSRYENNFIWLRDAGVALPAFNVEKPRIPLILNKQYNLFKLFQSDVGLLACQYAEGIQAQILNGETDINYGAIYENMVAQELHAHGFDLYYYNSKKNGELDFVVEKDGLVIPIEVKSGKDYTKHSALSRCLACKDFHLSHALIFCNGNFQEEADRLYAPIYMITFLEQTSSPAPIIYKMDLSGV